LNERFSEVLHGRSFFKSSLLTYQFIVSSYRDDNKKIYFAYFLNLVYTFRLSISLTYRLLLILHTENNKKFSRQGRELYVYSVFLFIIYKVVFSWCNMP